MGTSPADKSMLGVCCTDADGNVTLVHRYQGGDYGLEEIVEHFQLGEIEEGAQEDETVIVLSAKELRELKVMADTYSFDYEEGFIEMCLELHRFASFLKGDAFRFTANF